MDSGQTYVIMDALDECPDKYNDRQRLLQHLAKLMSSQFQNLHIIVTSRRERDIEDVLQILANASPICVSSSEVDKDVRIYVRAQLSQDKRMQSWPPDVKNQVEETLSTKANGM